MIKKMTMAASGIKRSIKFLVIIMISFYYLVAQPGPTPFICDGEAYLVSGDPSRLYWINQNVTPFTFHFISDLKMPYGAGGTLINIQVNNIGYRVVDNMLYGVALRSPVVPNSNYGLVKIDRDGNVFSVPTDPDISYIAKRFLAGDIDPYNDVMYLNTYPTTSPMYVVDLNTLMVTTKTLSPTSNVYVSDWAVNPVDGKLYGADGRCNPQAQIYKLDPSTGNITNLGSLAGLPCSNSGNAQYYGGAWFNAQGELFVYRDNDYIYKIDVSQLPPIVISAQSGEVGSSMFVDAAACSTDQGNILFSEVFYDTPGNENEEEWIELYNSTSETVDLSSWTIVDNNGTGWTYTFPSGTSIAPGTYLTVARNSAGFTALYGYEADLYGNLPYLNNGGDSLILYDSSNNEVDAVAWEGGAGAGVPDGWGSTSNPWASAGSTIVRIDPTVDTDTYTDWTTAANNGNPQTQTVQGNILFSEVFYDTLGNENEEEWIELYNASSIDVNIAGWKIIDNNGTGWTYTFPSGASMAPDTYLTVARNSAGFTALYGYEADLYGNLPYLNNGGDSLILYDSSNKEKDAVAWEGGAGAGIPDGWGSTSNPWASAGSTIVRSDPTFDTDTYTDWTTAPNNGDPQTQAMGEPDTTPPEPDVFPLPDVVGECSADIITVPTATDDQSGSIDGTTSDPLSYTEQGTYTVTWTYDDENGNTSTQTQTVIVEDVTSPVPDEATLPTVSGECSVEITSAPTATDNCAGSIPGTTSDPLSYMEQGTYTLTWTYDDGNGNTSTQTQTVTVEDITPPQIHLSNPACVEIRKWKLANMLTVSASDNCTPDVEFIIDKVEILNKAGRRVWGRGVYSVNGSDIYVYPKGRDWSVRITATAADANGNATTEQITKSLLRCNRMSEQMVRLIRWLYTLLWRFHRCW